MKIINPLYSPTNLQELAKDIKEKVEKKRLNIFQKIFRFFTRKAKKK